MTHPVWPLFDLRVHTPRLELRYIDDEMAAELAVLATKGIHERDFMPFVIPWSLEPSPALERNTMQFYWRSRAETSATDWNINLATVVDGQVAGTTALIAKDFPILRQFETGSWLGRSFQGKGIGKEMRIATLHLGFIGLSGEMATTSAWDDNGPSLGVTRSLGYEDAGTRRGVRQGLPASTRQFQMSRADFASRVQRDDIRLVGVDACLDLLGLGTHTNADTSTSAERPAPQ